MSIFNTIDSCRDKEFFCIYALWTKTVAEPEISDYAI